MAVLLACGGMAPLAIAAETSAERKPAAQEAPAPQALADGKAAREKRVGRLLKILLPLTGPTYERVRQSILKAVEKAQADGVHLVLILEFDIAKGQSEYGRGSTIGSAYDLANFLSGGNLNAATTVAYVPKTVQGHAVLPILACDAIVMAQNIWFIWLAPLAAVIFLIAAIADQVIAPRKAAPITHVWNDDPVIPCDDGIPHRNGRARRDHYAAGVECRVLRDSNVCERARSAGYVQSPAASGRACVPCMRCASVNDVSKALAAATISLTSSQLERTKPPRPRMLW